MPTPKPNSSPYDLIIFGGTGDLARRKLLPALLHRHLDGQMPAGSRVIGVARDGQDSAAYREGLREDLQRAVASEAEAAAIVEDFLPCLVYRAVDVGVREAWAPLLQVLSEHPDRVRVFYLATSPDLFAPICEQLRELGLAGGEARVVIEKPIGHDLESATRINDAVGAAFAEHQIYRIDHYLGKETVQNLVALRFGNALFEPLWKAEHIDHVQITVAETVGVEGRAAYYDRSGAMRDMVQNHILQLLCLVAMEPPAALSADAIRDEKLKVLRALKPIDAGNAHLLTVRGQYRAGSANGQPVPAYSTESGLPDSTVDTFVAIRAQVDNWRWAGVPFFLRTGKRLPQRVSEIVIQFRAVPHSIFGSDSGPISANRLVLRLQPDEGVKLWLMIKQPGSGGLRLKEVPLDMSFADTFRQRQPDAYERLLMDVVRGNPTLFMRRDEVEAAWRWVDPILAAWRASDDRPKPYSAGSWGPSAAVALIEREGRTWHEDGE